MQSKDIFYKAIKQLGKGMGNAEKALVGSKSWLTLLGEKLETTDPDEELSKAEILAKRKRKGDIIILSADELKGILREKNQSA